MKQQRTFTTGGNEYQVAIEIDENSLIDQTMNELNEAINYYTDQGHTVPEAIAEVQNEIGTRFDAIASFSIHVHKL